MNRDKFDNILAQKLASEQIEPPIGVWSKIEHDLEQLHIATIETATEPRPIHKLHSTGNRWFSYVAAASVLIAMVIIAAQYTMHQSIISESKLSMQDNLTEPPTRQQAQPIEHVIATEPALQRQPRQQLMANATLAPIKSTITHATIDTSLTDISTAKTIEPAKAATTQNAKSESGTQSHTNNATASATRSESESRSSASQKKQVDWESLLREQTEHKRPRKLLSASLFASNFGGSSGKSIENPTRMAMSQLMMNEIIEIDKSNNIVTQYDIPKSQKLHHKMPVSFGLSIGIGLNKNLSIETGLTYAKLASSAESSGISKRTLDQQLHYVGIPVALLYNIADGRRANLYARAGGALEKCVSAKRTITTSGENAIRSREVSKLDVNGVQASIGAALGGTIKLTKMLGLYVEPGIGYYFENNSQPESYRTENPVNFTMKAGLRINIR